MKLRVHIAPVGFEIDRITIPAKDMRADNKRWMQKNYNEQWVKQANFEYGAVEDGKFKKNVGPTRTGKTDILIKGRVRQGEIDIGLYLVRPGTEQIYCVGKDTIALK